MNAEEYRMINDLSFGSAYINSMDIKSITIASDRILVNREQYANWYRLNTGEIEKLSLLVYLLKAIRPSIDVCDLRKNKN